jgi:hypothetical protein
MSAEPPALGVLFARLLCDMMIPAECSAAIRAQGDDVAEARTFPVEIQQDDETILQTVTQQRRVSITRNYSDPQSNFCLLHEAWRAPGKQHGGIILNTTVLVLCIRTEGASAYPLRHGVTGAWHAPQKCFTILSNCVGTLKPLLEAHPADLTRRI